MTGTAPGIYRANGRQTGGAAATPPSGMPTRYYLRRQGVFTGRSPGTPHPGHYT